MRTTLQERVHGTPPPPTWAHGKLHRVLRVRKNFKNTGMKESNLLSLSYGRIVRKDIDTAEGLLPESFETYQIVEPGNIVMRLTDLQNDKRSLRQGLVHERGIITSAYDALEVGNDHDPRFWFYALLALDLAKYYYSLGGGVRQSINFSDFPNEWVGVPDKEQQIAIADFLDRETDRISQLIAKKERMLALLAETKRSKAAQLVTGGIDPAATLAPTGMSSLTDAPSHWRVRRIASLYIEADERGEEGFPVLSVSINWGISDRELGDEDRHRMVNHIEDKAAYKRVRPDDLVYNMMRAWQGAFGVARLDGLVSPAYVVARPKEAIHSLYFESLLRTPIWIEEFRRASKGIADFRQRLYWEHFRQVRVVLPPLEEQIAIAECIAAQSQRLDRLATPIETSVARLGELRASLITAAVTGQLDISNWRKKGATEHRADAIEAGIPA